MCYSTVLNKTMNRAESSQSFYKVNRKAAYAINLSEACFLDLRLLHPNNCIPKYSETKSCITEHVEIFLSLLPKQHSKQLFI